MIQFDSYFSNGLVHLNHHRLVTSYYSNFGETLGKVLLPWWLNCAAAVVLGMKAVSAGFLASWKVDGTIAGETR